MKQRAAAHARALPPCPAAMADAASLEAFLSHAVFVGAMTAEERTACTDAVACGRTSADELIADWRARVRDALWHRYLAVRAAARAVPPPDAPPLRFRVGDKVQAFMGSGRPWAPAVVISLWWRKPSMPPSILAPYQMRLEGASASKDDKEALICAPADCRSFVVAAGEAPPGAGEYDAVLDLGYAGLDSEEAEEWRQGGVSALQLACIHDAPATVRALLRRPLPDCDPDVAGGWGEETPLHACAQNGGLECAMWLLSAGADPRPRSGGRVAVRSGESRRGGEKRHGGQVDRRGAGGAAAALRGGVRRGRGRVLGVAGRRQKQLVKRNEKTFTEEACANGAACSAGACAGCSLCLRRGAPQPAAGSRGRFHTRVVRKVSIAPITRKVGGTRLKTPSLFLPFYFLLAPLRSRLVSLAAMAAAPDAAFDALPPLLRLEEPCARGGGLMCALLADHDLSGYDTDKADGPELSPLRAAGAPDAEVRARARPAARRMWVRSVAAARRAGGIGRIWRGSGAEGGAVGTRFACDVRACARAGAAAARAERRDQCEL
jgi:hypothetical protein